MTKEKLIEEIKTLEEKTDVAIREGNIEKMAKAENEYLDLYFNVAEYFESCGNRFDIREILTEWNALVRTNGRIIPGLTAPELSKFFELTT